MFDSSRESRFFRVIYLKINILTFIEPRSHRAPWKQFSVYNSVYFTPTKFHFIPIVKAISLIAELCPFGCKWRRSIDF